MSNPRYQPQVLTIEPSDNPYRPFSGLIDLAVGAMRKKIDDAVLASLELFTPGHDLMEKTMTNQCHFCKRELPESESHWFGKQLGTDGPLPEVHVCDDCAPNPDNKLHGVGINELINGGGFKAHTGYKLGTAGQ